MYYVRSSVGSRKPLLATGPNLTSDSFNLRQFLAPGRLVGRGRARDE